MDLLQLRADLIKDVVVSGNFLHTLHVRKEYLCNMLPLVLDNYAGHTCFTSSKRVLIDGIGQLSRMLLGTSMNGDVEEFSERHYYNHRPYFPMLTTKRFLRIANILPNLGRKCKTLFHMFIC